jgi:hypothetical protein
MNSEQADNTSSALDRELNEALVNANIANGYEEFLALFDRFYAAPCDGRDRRSRRYASVFHASQRQA